MSIPEAKPNIHHIGTQTLGEPGKTFEQDDDPGLLLLDARQQSVVFRAIADANKVHYCEGWTVSEPYSTLSTDTRPETQGHTTYFNM